MKTLNLLFDGACQHLGINSLKLSFYADDKLNDVKSTLKTAFYKKAAEISTTSGLDSKDFKHLLYYYHFARLLLAHANQPSSSLNDSFTAPKAKEISFESMIALYPELASKFWNGQVPEAKLFADMVTKANDALQAQLVESTQQTYQTAYAKYLANCKINYLADLDNNYHHYVTKHNAEMDERKAEIQKYYRNKIDYCNAIIMVGMTLFIFIVPVIFAAIAFYFSDRLGNQMHTKLKCIDEQKCLSKEKWQDTLPVKHQQTWEAKNIVTFEKFKENATDIPEAQAARTETNILQVKCDTKQTHNKSMLAKRKLLNIPLDAAATALITALADNEQTVSSNVQQDSTFSMTRKLA